MSREKGYVSPLLSNLAVDYSKKAREGMVSPLLFPHVSVGKPSGRYATFDAETAFKVPDTTLAGGRSQAREFDASGKMESYATTPHGLKSFIDKANLEFMDGPFRLWEQRKVELLVSKLEMSQERRVAQAVLGLSDRSTSLAGSGAGAANKWSAAGGDPFAAINAAIGQMFFRPNLMVMAEAVYDALEYHPKLIEKLGEANLVKKVDEANLSKLFRVDKVVVAKGKADFGKRKADKSVNPTVIWGDSVVLAYTSDEWDQPCAGKTLSVNYAEADGQRYVVRTWDEQDGGVLGGEYVQVAHDTAELVVCKELLYSIQAVL